LPSSSLSQCYLPLEACSSLWSTIGPVLQSLNRAKVSWLKYHTG
jgi:hypothetical protein